MSELADCGAIFSDAADFVTTKMMSLGPKPRDPSEAAIWEINVVRLQSQSASLRTISAKLFDLDALQVLDSVKEQLSAVSQATSAAEKTLKTIAKINDVANGIAKLISVGAQIAAFVANPAVGAGVALLPAVDGFVATVKELKSTAAA